ncbi:MAG TPA: phosphonate ABC transporter, permease protein PhnE [Meiothermus sp.]|nr:phosphonate ABC transporter, permease protein PhnE [Meiothermus sp.]
MTTILLYLLVGAVLAALSGVAKGSMRRLVIGGALGILVAFLAFPFSRSLGFLSRETVDPTLLALVPTFPLLILIPVLAAATLYLAARGGSWAAWAGIIGGGGIALGGLVWYAQPAQVVRLAPISGLMEGLAALVLAVAVALLAQSRPRLRLPIYAVAALAGMLAFAWLSSSSGGHTYLPRMAGYYKLLMPTGPQTERKLVEDYNAAIPQKNAILKEIGQPTLEPITSLADLKGSIPQEASEAGYRLLQPARTQYGALALFLLAGLMLGAGLMGLRRPNLQEAGDLRAGMIFAGVVSILLPAFEATEFQLQRLVKGWPFLVGFFDKAWPPNLANPDANIFPLQSVLSEMALTIEIALVGTFLAAIFAIPSSFLAARNLTQGSAFMRGVFAFMRGFYNVDRGVDTLILALIFVAAVGLGPFAGVLAMAIHSIADLGKLYSEAIENVDRGPIEALESTGTAGVNVLRWAILPQVLPLFVSYTLYRFEINFRVSVVLGLVGAGGIGYFIKGAMDAGNYDQMIIGVIAIVIVVNLIDFASSWLRSRLV